MTRAGLRALLLPLLATVGCSSAMGVIEPIADDDATPTATPESVGLDLSSLEEVSRELAASDDHEIHSILVARGDVLVFERYFHGFGPSNPHDLRSATKSVTSLLTGIAIERGGIADLDAPLMDYLGASYPEVRDRDDILIRHLLTMSSGVDCDDSDRSTRGQEDRMYGTRDWVEYYLALDRPYQPGDTTRYCTGGVVALGEAIARGAGMDFADFADQALFSPLGIRNYEWARFDDGRKVDTGGHLLLTPRGMARIGMLVLAGGQWDERQIVPAGWIERSKQPHTSINGESYGYLWWRNTLHYGGAEGPAVELISARGNGGQAIFIVPEHDLVAVFTAGYYNSDQVQVIYDLFYNVILPSVPELQRYAPGGSKAEKEYS